MKLLFLLLLPLISCIPMNKLRKHKATGRIINGKDATPYKYPWTALLIINQGQICGGSVLSVNYVISAEHCVKLTPINMIEVMIGFHEWNAPNEPYRQYRGVQNVFYYKDRKGRTTDICMTKVDQPFQQTPKFKVINLPNHKLFMPIDNSKCIFTGIGRIVENPRTYPKYLQVIDLYIINRKQCAQFSHLEKFEFCAGVQNGGPCYGDSGSGLVCNNGLNQPVLTGIENGFQQGAPCGSLKYPAIFARVSYFIRWIKHTLKI